MAAAAVAAAGPTRLLEVCAQGLGRFLRNAELRRLAWLREAEEQGLRLLHSTLATEPELMAQTPSQRRRSRRRRSSCPGDGGKEPGRRRLSRRRSNIMLLSPRPGSQQPLSKELPPVPSHCREEAPGCPAGAQTSVRAEPLVLAGKRSAEAPTPRTKMDSQVCPEGADGSDAAGRTGTGELVSEGDAAPELYNVRSVAQTAGEEQEAPKRASTPKATRSRETALLPEGYSPRGLREELFEDSGNKVTPLRSRLCRRSERRSCRTSLAEKYSLARKRESLIQRSIGRAVSKRAAAQESSSASSRVSCQSSLEVFAEEDVTSSVRPGLEPNSLDEKTPGDILSRSGEAADPAALPTRAPELLAGLHEGGCVSLSREPQNQEQPRGAKAQENPTHFWTRSCKQAVGALWSGAQPSVADKHKGSANQGPQSSSPATKVVRPLKSFLQAVQRHQLLPSPGPTGRGGGIKSFIRCNAPGRPDVKGDFVEKERQRLESLRKKQEAEEQRRRKVEEEKLRRQAEMKQKREERLRKALQARERVEQMEEEKKKRMEQKILQSDERVREEKVLEERSKKKLSKKLVEASAWRQKVLRGEEEGLQQQEPLRRRRENEGKERGNRVLELKNLVEQRQAEQMERDRKQQGKKPDPQPEPTLVPAKHPQEEGGLQEPQCLGPEGTAKQPEAPGAAAWLSKAVKKSASYLGPLKGTRDLRHPKVSENNYGMDLNSDDSTDDENEPRKPVPAWAGGSLLNEAIVHQYYHPVDVDQIFGLIPMPRLEDIFGKSKPRYFKRTSSAVWHSPPGSTAACGPSCNFGT